MTKGKEEWMHDRGDTKVSEQIGHDCNDENEGEKRIEKKTGKYKIKGK